MSAGISSFVHALGWSLIHLMWQGLLVGVAAALALVVLRDARPQLRYAVSCAALLSCLLLPAAGVVNGLRSDAGFQRERRVAAPGIGTIDREPEIVPFRSWGAVLHSGVPALVAVWSIIAALLALRLLIGIRWVSRVASSGAANTDTALQLRLARLAKALGIRRAVFLRIVTEFDSPVAAGVWRPVVMVPAALVTRMPVEMIEALLAHELAHIRRHDYLVNMIQSAVESLLFYHPVVWWLSRRIRIEREQIADALAAQVLGEPRRLAVALHGLAEFQLARTAIPVTLATHANGGDLMARIQRLIRPHHHTVSWKMALGIFALTLACASFTAACLTAYASDTVPGAEGITVDVTAPKAVQVATRHAVKPMLAGRAAEAESTGGSIRCNSCSFERDAASGYAIVTAGGEEITMSGSSRDLSSIKALRTRVGGDFIWARRDGKAYVIQDPVLITKALEAWKPANALAARMDSVSDRMELPSAQMEEIARTMEAITEAWAPDEQEMERVSREMESLSLKHEKLAVKMAAVAEQMVRIGSSEESALDRHMEALEEEMELLDTQMEPLHEEMEKLGAVMEIESREMEAATEPLQALGLQMEEASRPMQTLGAELEGLGEEMEALSEEANRRTIALIDEALRTGKAVPADENDLNF